MIPHQPIGDAKNLAWMVEERLRREEKNLDQVKVNFGQGLLNSIFDGMVLRMTGDLIACQTEQDRVMVQAMVAVTAELKKHLVGALIEEENRRREAEQAAKERNTSWQ